MTRIKNWPRKRRDSERTTWENTITGETIHVDRYYPMSREEIMFDGEERKMGDNWWKFSETSDLYHSRLSAEKDAIEYMRDNQGPIKDGCPPHMVFIKNKCVPKRGR